MDSPSSGHPRRPPIVSQQSSSLPSTPRQQPREIPFHGRTPSPVGAPKVQSPRSNSSETHQTMPSLRNVAPTCRFMSTQTSRRRIPYNIGTDSLGPAKETPKKTLTQSEEQRLSGDMRKLYEELLPSDDSQKRRAQMVEKLREILREEWPKKEYQVSMFGSSGNSLYTSKSDVDICITTKELDTVCSLAEMLSKRGMQKVTCVHAKAVPIVKIWDPELQLACDINVNNLIALRNTAMVQAYIELDPRVRPLAMIVKYWTKRRIICEASGGTLSSYTWTLLLINFLQRRVPPVLPKLDLVDEQNRQISNFGSQVEKFRGFGNKNRESLGELFFQFFRHYGFEMEYDWAVMSVRKGGLLHKKDKNWHLATNNRLCVEEPFNTERNLGNTADDTAFRGLHLELRQAFQRVADAKDIATGVCEPYEFPKEEPKPIFERPPAQPRPVISRSHSQSGRGGRGSGNARGNKHHLNARNGPSGRRASSAASFGQAPPILVPNPQFVLTSAPEQYLRAHQAQGVQAPHSGLHDHLSQISQRLSNDEQKLRLQSLIISQQMQMQAQAVASGQSRSQSTVNFSSQARPPPLGVYRTSRYGSFEEPPATAPLMPPYSFGPQQDSPVAMSHSSSQQGTDTNSSSPMLAPATPLRRTVQRPSVPLSPGTAVRSQSQPARAIAPQLLAGYPRFQLQNKVSAPGSNGRQEQTAVPLTAHPIYATAFPPNGHFYLRSGEAVPREYLGYAFGGSPSFAPQQYDPGLVNIPAFEDLRRPGRRLSSNSRQGSSSTLVHEPSRTPSPHPDISDYLDDPSMMVLERSYTQPAASPLATFQSAESTTPLIVNGSSRGAGRAMSDSQPRVTRPRELSESTYSIASTVEEAATESPKEPFFVVDTSGSNGQASSEGLQHVNGLESASSGRSGTAKAKPPAQPTMTQPPTKSKLPSPNALGRPEQTFAEKARSSPSHVSPEMVGRSPMQGPTPTRSTMPPLELNAGNSAKTRDTPQVPGATVLSPVHETRTPSPTWNKKVDTPRKELQNGLNGVSSPGSGPKAARPLSMGGVSQTHNKDSAVNGNVRNESASANTNSPLGRTSMVPPAAMNSNPWQQATGKKNRKSRQWSSQSDIEFRRGGEPMPEKESERKGG